MFCSTRNQGPLTVPSAFTVFPNVQLVILGHWGLVTTQDSVELMISYNASPQARAQFDYLVDLSLVTRFDVDLSDLSLRVSRMAHNIMPRDPTAKTAIYAPDDIAFGLARMYQSMAEGRLPNLVGVFRTREATMDFLGRDDDPQFHKLPPL